MNPSCAQPNIVSETPCDWNFDAGVWLVACLQRLGVRHFVVSPGSRSTPLALGVWYCAPTAYTVIVDERSAGFYALGRVKAGGAPVALICTSGSALAHYFPAVIEAHECGLPLIIISADRPPELRSCHPGQTIDQVKLFGCHVRHAVELPVPYESVLASAGKSGTTVGDYGRAVRGMLQKALWHSGGAAGGPVHINAPYREPFWPSQRPNEDLATRARQVQAAAETLLPAFGGAGGIAADGTVAGGRVSGSSNRATVSLPERTLVLAGALPGRLEEALAQRILAASAQAGLPVFADATSPLRHHVNYLPNGLVHYDRILRHAELAADLEPQAIVLLGDFPVSKVLRQWLERFDLPVWQVGPGKPGMNAIQGHWHYLGIDGTELLIWPVSSLYGSMWQQLEQRFAGALEAGMAQPHELFEGDVHACLAEALPPRTPIFWANSLAIRDAEWFFPATGKGFLPFSQRGANGIDGTVSLATGIAAQLNGPLVLVVGDLAFLHDHGGLAVAAMVAPAGLMVVVLDNGGGGIFDYLPVSDHAAFEPLFATPATVDMEPLVRAHGGAFQRLDSITALRDAVTGWSGCGLQVWAISIDRSASRTCHRQFLQNL